MRVYEKIMEFVGARIVQNQQRHARRNGLARFLPDALQRRTQRFALVVSDVNRASDQAGQRFFGKPPLRGSQLLQTRFSRKGIASYLYALHALAEFASDVVDQAG